MHGSDNFAEIVNAFLVLELFQFLFVLSEYS